MTWNEVSVQIDALRRGREAKDEAYSAQLSEQIQDIEQASVRIERMKHRLNAMEARL